VVFLQNLKTKQSFRYFLFLLQQKDYPVFDIFEKYIVNLKTERFSIDLDEDYKDIYIEQMRKLNQLGLLKPEHHKSFDKKLTSL